MDDREDDVISVTMSRNAAEKFKAALTFAECRLTPDSYPPVGEKDEIAYVHTDWLRWGVSRVEHAETNLPGWPPLIAERRKEPHA